MSQDRLLSAATKQKIAAEITKIHTQINEGTRELRACSLPDLRARLRFHRRAIGTHSGPELCSERGHTIEEKSEMLHRLWGMLQGETGVPTEQLAISLQEIPSSNAIEKGEIMRVVEHR